MHAEDLRLLADRAEAVRGRPDQRLAEVHARITTARRRRVAGATAGLAALVVCIAVIAGSAGLTKDHRPPPPASTTTPTPVPVNPSPARALVYSDDPLGDYLADRVRTVHVGDREVRIDQTLGTRRSWNMHVTDAGVVYPRGDGSVWFTDGGQPQQLATKLCSQFLGAIATGSVGPLAAWFECPAGQQGTLVVVDTGTGHEVTRLPIRSCGAELESACGPDAIIGEHVYFMRGLRPRLYRLDLQTGRVIAATAQMRDDDLRTRPRALLVGDSLQTANPGGGGFEVVGSQLVAIDPRPSPGPRRTRAFDAATGKPVQLFLPGGYRPVPAPDFLGDQVSGHYTRFELFEWLDDDTVALAQKGDNSIAGDILTCHLSDGRCQLAVKGHIPAGWGAPDPMRLLPGGGLFG